MKYEGPSLQQLTHRLAECPSEFLEDPRSDSRGTVHVAAVVHDLLTALKQEPPDDTWVAQFTPGGEPIHVLMPGSAPAVTSAPSLMNRLLSRISGATEEPGLQVKDRDWLRCVLVACWLLHDEWFRAQSFSTGAVRTFLAGDLRELANTTQAQKLVNDADRREELARLALKALEYRPKGETVEQAQDRLATLNTTERMRLLKAVREAEQRAREIREAMAKKAAEEAAAKYNRE